MSRLPNCRWPGALALAFAFHAAAQDGAVALARNYRVLLNNDRVEVVAVRYRPHEALPVHEHSHYPTVYVYLSDSPAARFTHAGPTPYTLVRRPVRTGWFRVSPGRIETHAVTNLGPVTSHFLRVECKQIPLGAIADEFRYRQTPDLTRSSAITDYASPQMTIRRYIVTRGRVQEAAAEPQPTLLIAFAAALVRAGSAPAKEMAAGTVQWLPGGVAFTLRSPGAGAAHMLAIRRCGEVPRPYITPSIHPSTLAVSRSATPIGGFRKAGSEPSASAWRIHAAMA